MGRGVSACCVAMRRGTRGTGHIAHGMETGTRESKGHRTYQHPKVSERAIEPSVLVLL